MELEPDIQGALSDLLGMWIWRCKKLQNTDLNKHYNWQAAAAAFRVQLIQVNLGSISEATRDQLVRTVKAEQKDIDQIKEQRLFENFNLLIQELESLT